LLSCRQRDGKVQKKVKRGARREDSCLNNIQERTTPTILDGLCRPPGGKRGGKRELQFSGQGKGPPKPGWAPYDNPKGRKELYTSERRGGTYSMLTRKAQLLYQNRDGSFSISREKESSRGPGKGQERFLKKGGNACYRGRLCVIKRRRQSLRKNTTTCPRRKKKGTKGIFLVLF